MTGRILHTVSGRNGLSRPAIKTAAMPLPMIWKKISGKKLRMEILRDTARREQAPDELLQLSDSDLISALSLIRDGKPVRAAFLLAGK